MFLYFCICVFGHICEVVQLGGSSWHAAELATAVPRETAGEAEAPPGNLHKFISHQIHKYRSTEEGKYKGQKVIECQPMDCFKREAVMATCVKSCCLIFVVKNWTDQDES